MGSCHLEGKEAGGPAGVLDEEANTARSMAGGGGSHGLAAGADAAEELWALTESHPHVRPALEVGVQARGTSRGTWAL